MDKEQGAEMYEKKFKKRGGENGNGYRCYKKGGNSYTNKKSSPTCYASGRARANYLVEKRNLDIPDYKPVCVDPKESAKVMRSGGTLPAGPNQYHEITESCASQPSRPQREQRPRCCHLSEINPNLYLANYDYMTSLDVDLGVTVINLTDKRESQFRHKPPLSWRYREKPRVYNIGYRDCRQITSKQFNEIYCICKNIINNAHGDVYVVCNKGVNRSVSIAIQLAMDKGYSYEWALNYITCTKQKHTADWDTMTNPRLCRILRSAEASEHFLSESIKINHS